MTWCEQGDLPVAWCGHCIGLVVPNLDSARLPELLPQEPAVVTMARRVARQADAQLSDLARLLIRTAALYADLEDGLQGTRSGGTGERKGSGGDERPMPLQADVAEHRHLLLRGLRYWVGRLARTTGTASVPALTAYLIANLARLSAEDQAELRENLQDWQRGVGGRLDLPTLRGTIPLGPCPNSTGELWQCDGTMRLLLPADKGRQPWLQCQGCRGRWDVTELPAALDVSLPLSALAELTGTPVRTLQWRVQHLHLEVDAAGRAKLGDVLRTDCAVSP